MRKILFTIFIAASFVLVLSGTPLRALQSRLSMAVAEVSTGTDVQQFLQNPSLSYVQAYVKFAPDFPNDVLINIDEEFLDGVNNPRYVSGGDWMAFIGIQRTGTVWVAAGTLGTMLGFPNATPDWKIFNLGAALQPNSWYLMRTVADLSTRQFKSFTVTGPGINKTIDLFGCVLNYPNYLPFDNRVMTYLVGDSRSANMASGTGAPVAYFTNVSGGTFWPDGTDHSLFASSFQSQTSIGPQPLSGPPIVIENYVQGRWYLERSESLFTIQPTGNPNQSLGVANARLN